MAESSNQGQARRQRRKLNPRSKVWNHFARVIGDDGKEKAKCMRCGIQYAIHGTTNQRKHLKECSGEEAAPPVAQPPPLPCAPSPSRPGGSSDCRVPGLEEASRDLARMIALHGYDSSVVEDDCFRSFVCRLNPGFKVPSRVAIEEMCDGIFDEARRDSLSSVRSAHGRLSFAVGKAKTIEAGEVVYISCHFIDDQWKLHKVVLDAVVSADHHFLEDGPILGVAVVSDDDVSFAIDVISEHEDRVSLVAYDIADDYTMELEDYIEEINSDRNLSCDAAFVDNVLHSIAQCLEIGTDFAVKLWLDMERLNLIRQERLQLVSELGLDYEWAYDQHWCALYFSLEVLRKRGSGRFICRTILQGLGPSIPRHSENFCLHLSHFKPMSCRVA